ncbi:hypothetical protein CRYUN_Cryun38cG0066000 [Craigia yunnanensis]
MTAEEVTLVHVAEEEVVVSSSSKVEIVVEKDKEKEKEDLSNGANGRIVKEETDGDGSYVFVNGNDAVNGPVESDLENNVNGIGGEDRGVEDLETKGEVKSESGLLNDLEGEDESCIGIVDQDKESMEMCHVEDHVDEQKSGDLVESGPVSAINAEGVSETSRADQNGVSESPEDLSDRNGDGLPNGITKHTVLEVAVVDTSAEHSDEVSSVSVSDSNGGSLANGSVKDNVVDSRSKENKDSEMAVADDGDCSGDGLANDSSEDNVVDSKTKENEESEMAVADDGDCNGDVLANDSAKDTVSEGAVDSWNEQNGVLELPISDNGVPTVSVSDSNEHGLPNVRAKDTISEAVDLDSKAEQNDGVPVFVFVSNSNGDALPADTVEDTVSEVSNPEPNESCNRVEADSHGPVSNGNGDRPEKNGFSAMPETVQTDVVSGYESVKGGENLIAMNKVPVEGGLDLEHNSERDLSSEADTHLEKETGRGSISDECGQSLLNVHTQDGISETAVISDSVDSSQNSQGQPSEVVESTLSPVTNENENVTVERVVYDTTTDSNIDTGASADVVESSSSTVTLKNVTVESGVSDTTAEALLPSPVDDEKVETEVIKSEKSRGSSDFHHVENSQVDIEVDSGTIDDDSKSSCLANGLKSETELSSDSIVSEEAEVSKGLAECDNIEPITASDTDEKLAGADVQNDSSLAAPLSNDEKAPAAVENLSAVSNYGFVHESGVSNCDTNDNEQTCAVVKGGIQFGSVVSCQEPEGLDEVERKRPFYFLIRVPRYDDENLKEKIRLAQIRVDEKTQIRDAIRIEMQSKRATCKEYGNNFDAAISNERAARDLHRSKRQEIESLQSVMNIEDIDANIRNMEHMIQHETLPLKDEKQFIREIKQLKQTRARLSSHMGRQDEVQQGLDQKDQIEERLKSLKKEAEQLKVNLLKAEAITKAVKKKYHDENEKLNKLLSQFKAADDIRQEAYAQLQSLKKESYEKNKYFWQYRDDGKTANDLASKGDREAVQNLCVNQVEKLHDLWNNDEFRKEYMRCNVRSTLRRLRTLDGRALGPDEEPPVIPQVVNDKVAKDHTVSSSILEERTQEKVALAKAEKANDKPVAKAVEQKNQTSKSEKSLKSVPPATGSTTASSRDKIEEAGEEKSKRTKEEEEVARKAELLRKEEEAARKRTKEEEEEEVARKAEELRKEEEAAKLREQRRLEEIAKAKEALERKRRIAEKTQARAALRAQKEAEQKEKEREKKAKKKERRKVAAATVGDASVTDETGSAPTSETPAETAKESENKEKPVTVAKRPQKPSQFTKQTKAKSIPPPLRNRSKRRMQPWMWVLLTTLVIFALFLIGNYNFSFNFGLQRFNF